MKPGKKNTKVFSNHEFKRITFPIPLQTGKEIVLEANSFSALLAREPLQGEIITVTDATGKEYRGRIVELGRDWARCHIFEELREPTEPPFDLFLFQALPDKERIELIIQKAVELGVKTIVPFKSVHSIALQEREAVQPKAHRWQPIALKAAKQCRRAIVPWVAPYCSFEQARGCMEVDFRADPAELAQATPHLNKPPFRVVYPRYRDPVASEVLRGGWDPNQRIFEYLQSRNSPDDDAEDKPREPRPPADSHVVPDNR